VDPVPDPLLLRKSASVGNRTRTSESVARYSDHYTTKAGTHGTKEREFTHWRKLKAKHSANMLQMHSSYVKGGGLT
jgi:hypothetical protein